MAYRKTERVLAEIGGRRDLIVASAIDIISKLGVEALTADKIAERAKLSVGLIYRHFPDMGELRTFVFAQLLARDLKLLREAGNIENGIRSWAKQLAATPRLAAALANDFAYRDGMKRELVKMIRVVSTESPNTMAAVVCGAVIEASRSTLVMQGVALTTILLKAMGVRSRATA